MSILANLRRRTLARCLASSRPTFPPSCAQQPSPYVPKRCLSDEHHQDEALPLRRVGNDVPASPHEELDLDGFAESLIEMAEEETDPEASALETKGGWKAPIFPVSPLMDPKFLEARRQHQIPKEPPSNEPTLFQRRLASNLYAIALATPVRLCQLTKTPLPSFFLQDMQLAMHPSTGNPIYVPRGRFLEKKPLKSRQAKTEVPIQRTPTEGDQDPNSTILWQDRNLPKDLAGEETEGKRIGPSIYTLASRELLASMQDKRAGFGSLPHTRLLSHRFMRKGNVKDAFFSGHFRPDMHDFVLEMARRRLLEILINLDSQKRQVYLSGFDNWEHALSVSSSRKVVFMWTKPVPGSEDAKKPGEFATIMNGTTRVPLHNLEMLLGREKLAELRSHKGDGKPCLFDKPIVKIKSKNMTLGLQMRLWWLQCYLAEHRVPDNPLPPPIPSKSSNRPGSRSRARARVEQSKIMEGSRIVDLRSYYGTHRSTL